MNRQNNLTLGTMLDGLADEWQHNQINLDDVIAEIGRLGLGPGIELVNTHNLFSQDKTKGEFARYFCDLLDQNGLFPSCLRISPVEETPLMFDVISANIALAAQFGFPVVSVFSVLGVDLLEQIIPIAEKFGVQVACEVHSPMTIDDPRLTEWMEFYDKIQSPAIGLAPDLGCTMFAIPDDFWRNVQSLGASDELISSANRIWKSEITLDAKFSRMSDACRATYATPLVSRELKRALVLFGRMPLDDWKDILPYARHIHGSFYEVALHISEPTIPYPQLIQLLKDGDYSGTLSAKWEGRSLGRHNVGFPQMQEWHVMCRRLLLD